MIGFVLADELYIKIIQLLIEILVESRELKLF